MAGEVYRIEIPIEVEDRTDPGVSNATKNVSKFDEAAKKTEKQLQRMNRTKFQIMLTAMDKASQVVNKVAGAAKGLAGKAFSVTLKAVDMVTKPFRTILGGLNSALGLMGMSLGVTGVIIVPLKLVADRQNITSQFEILLGSAASAKDRMQELTDFASQTPFTRDEIFEASRILQIFTGEALSTGDGLKMVGDIAAGTQKDFNDVALWIARMYDALQNGQPIGMMTSSLQEMGALSGEGRVRLEKLAESGLDISAIWPEVVSEFSRFNGMMELMSKNLKNLFNGVKTFATNNILMRLGTGFSNVIKPALEAFKQWRIENPALISELGDTVEKGAEKMAQNILNITHDVIRKIRTLLQNPKFQQADLFGKIKIAWDELIASPFTEWWNSKGKPFFEEKAQAAGHALGSGLNRGLMALLGLDVSSAIEDGSTIGGSFAQGFLNGFDADAVGKALKTALKNVLKDAIKVLPGGDDPSSTSWLSAALVGYVGSKAAKPLIGAGKGAFKAGSWIKGLFGNKGGGVSAEGRGPTSLPITTMHVTAGVVHVYGSKVTDALKNAMPAASGAAGKALPPLIGTGGKAGQFALPAAGGGAGAGGTAKVLHGVGLANGTIGTTGSAVAAGMAKVGVGLGSGATTVGGAAAVGAGSIAGGIGGLAGIAAGIWDIIKGTKKEGKDAKDSYVTGGTKIGMVGAGAAAGAGIGALFGGVGAVPGALIGAGIGGIGALLGGNKAGKALSDSTDEGGWLNNAGKAVGNFFTETVPKKASEFWNATASFFTETIPEALTSAGQSIKVFFSTTLPRKWKEFWEGVGNFFTETIPYALGYAAGAVTVFFTETLPEKLGEFWNGVTGFFSSIGEWASSIWNDKIMPFFTETLPQKIGFFIGSIVAFFTSIPEWASCIWNDHIVPFFTVTIPAKFGEFWAVVGDFFSAIGEFASVVWNDHIVPFFTETIPEKLKEFWEGVAVFFTETLPTWASDVWNNGIVPFFTETIPAAIKTLWDGVAKFITETVPEWIVNVKSVVTTFFTETIPNAVKDFFGKIGSNFSAGYDVATGGNGNKAPHAWGGHMNTPHMGIVAEAGPESIIPTSPGKRHRGLDLWYQTGRMLGVRPYAEGGIIGGDIPDDTALPVSMGAGNQSGLVVHVNVNLNPVYQIMSEGGHLDEEEIVSIIKKYNSEITDALAQELASQLAAIFSNMPVGGVA